jgi:hypothetical protein
MNKVYVLAVVVIFGAGVFAGKSLIKPVVKIEERLVEKRDIVTQIKEITKPDGTKEIVTIIQEKTITKNEKTISPEKTKHQLSALVGTNTKILAPIYGIEYNRRFTDNTKLGVWGMSNGTIGLSVGLEF